MPGIPEFATDGNIVSTVQHIINTRPTFTPPIKKYIGTLICHITTELNGDPNIEYMRAVYTQLRALHAIYPNMGIDSHIRHVSIRMSTGIIRGYHPANIQTPEQLTDMFNQLKYAEYEDLSHFIVNVLKDDLLNMGFVPNSTITVRDLKYIADAITTTARDHGLTNMRPVIYMILEKVVVRATPTILFSYKARIQLKRGSELAMAVRLNALIDYHIMTRTNMLIAAQTTDIQPTPVINMIMS